jgi:D-alanyl-D-alanine carboxypeptidase/D-alanyl-D-alanine-endopeptidase (penicillin-binding protein 4)
MNKLLSLLFLSVGLSLAGQTPSAVEPTVVLNSIEKAFETLKNDPLLKNASLSFYVYDIDNKVKIAEGNPNTSLVTASTMKVVTTATALDIIGSYKKFETEISYDGFIDTNCTLHGNLYIKGGGDPTLGSRFFNKNNNDIMQPWIQEVANLGIHHITGRIIGDASYFPDEYVPATWGWGDMGNYYGAGVSGLTIYDNTLNFYFKSGPEKNDSTFVECIVPYSPDLFVDNRVKASDRNKDEAYIYGGPFDPYRLIRGRIPKGEEDFLVKGAMHDPAYIAAFELEAKLWEMGISVAGQATTERRLRLFEGMNVSKVKKTSITKKLSPSISKIVYWTNLISNNLFAETLLRHIGVATYGDGSVYSSTLAVEKHWKNKGIDMEGFSMNDGSGLSRANAVSAKHLVDILVYMKSKSKYSKSFVSSLPIAGKTGTLKSYGRKTLIQGNLRAKSGTMTRVKSFAGYVKSKSGKNLSFAIIANNYNCSTSQIGKKLEKLMIALGNFNG